MRVTRKLMLLVPLLAASLLGNRSEAQFTDTFDTYTPGPLAAQSVWQEWRTSTNVDPDVTATRAWNLPHSVVIVGEPGPNPGDDVVFDTRNLPGGIPTSGQWVLSVKSYVPASAMGAAYFIMLNQYGVVLNWSIEVKLDAGLGQVVNDGPGGQILPLILDQWVPITAIVDLDNDEVDLFYGSQPLFTDTSWKNGIGAPGVSFLSALDLYGGEPGTGGTTGIYFDHVRLYKNVVFDINPRIAGIGTSVTLQAFGGKPGGFGMLFVTGVNGAPVFLSTPVVSLFNANKRWSLAGTLQNFPGPGPIDVSFRILGIGINGNIVQSQDEIITLQ